MNFDTPQFIFFVGAGLMIYSWMPPSGRRYVLLVLGLLWYACWRSTWPLVLLGAALVNYWGFRGLPGKWGRPLSFSVLIALNVLLFLGLKALPAPPFGTSFFCFLMIACVVDLSRGSVKDPSRIDFPEYLLCVSFFPLLVAGPLTRYERLSSQLRSLGPLKAENIADGMLIFSYGFAKRFLIGRPLEAPSEALLNTASGWNALVVASLLATFRTYVTFSAYCDMGRGVARCFGVVLEPNFRPFYYAKDPNDFWQRWNITVGTWIRDYVTLPVMLRFGRKLGQDAILVMAFFVLGLWHGLAPHWILFGIFNGLVVAAHFRARASTLGRRKVTLRVLDALLLVILFVGNGLLSSPDGVGIISAGLSGPLFGDSSALLGATVMQDKVLMACVALLLVFEYFQERAGNLDFYLALPARARLVAAGCLLVLFLNLLHEGFLRDPVELPPLYFRL